MITGQLTACNTSSFAVGDQLFVDDTTAGDLTATKPTGNVHIQQVATVARSDAANGVLLVQSTGRVAGLPQQTENAVWVGDSDFVPTELVAPTNSVLGRLASAAVAWLTGTQLKDLIGLVFGDDYSFTIDKTRSTTTSTTFQTKLSVTTPALIGTFEVAWGAVVDQNNTGDKVEVQCQNTTDALLVGCDVPIRIEPKDTSNRYSTGAIVDNVVFTGSAKTFEIQYRQQDGNTAGIQAAWIRYYRVA